MKETLQPVEIGGHQYEYVAASQANQVLGTAGASGDFLARLIVMTTTEATAQVDIKDGAGTAIRVHNTAGVNIGTEVIELGIRSVNGPWQITTGAGVAVLAIGQFSI